MICTVTPVRSDQIDMLHKLKDAALVRFGGHSSSSPVFAKPVDFEVLVDAIHHGQAWLAHDTEAAGFIVVRIEGHDVIIVAIGALPGHGRDGIEACLLEHACDWATEAAYRSISVETRENVLQGKPFYTRHGFTVMDCAYARTMPGWVWMRRQLEPSTKGWSRWPAPAKLNLFLRITGRRADGYHELQTVFQLLDRGDEVRLRLREDGVIRRGSLMPGVAEVDDLLVRAAVLLRDYSGVTQGVDIEVTKRIPLGGGLGGGSSDAATVLVALNHLWRVDLHENDLASLGCQLGADVPVFVRGRSAWAQGIGEQLTPLALSLRWYVLVDPGEPVSTAALFKAAELTRQAFPATIDAFVSGNVVDNAFEPVVRDFYPKVAAMLDWLGSFGHARLSGSGACGFVEVNSRARAVAVVRRCPGAWHAWIAAGVRISPLHEARIRHATFIASGSF